MQSFDCASDAPFFSWNNQAFHFFFNAVPILEPESQEEQTTDHSDDNLTRDFVSISLTERVNLGSHKSLLTQLSHSRENRKSFHWLFSPIAGRVSFPDDLLF
jgi:hypothetical protein